MKKEINYQQINKETIERWIKEEDWEWGKPISHDEYVNALHGNFDIALTPTKYVPHQWFGDLKGKRILGLASGGGQQMPIFAALGAICTVIDISDLQLESERVVAQREGYDIRIIKGDITKPLPFDDEEFDIIFSPVSYCYLEKLDGLFKECFRVLKQDGKYMLGVDNAINYITNDETTIMNRFPFNPLIHEEQMKSCMEDDCGVQFSHSTEEVIGGLLHTGFTIKDIYDDINNYGRLAELKIPTYYALLLQK